jgi:hypothetical protein
VLCGSKKKKKKPASIQVQKSCGFSMKALLEYYLFILDFDYQSEYLEAYLCLMTDSKKKNERGNKGRQDDSGLTTLQMPTHHR